MGFVKFSRVFRFIGLFVGLVVVAYGALLYFIDVIYPLEQIEELAAGQGYTIEALLAEYKKIALYTFIIGGPLIVFGIICFIVFGVNKNKLYSRSSSGYNSSPSQTTSYRSSTSDSYENAPIIKSRSREFDANYYRSKYIDEFETVAKWWFDQCPDCTDYRIDIVRPTGDNYDYKAVFTFVYIDEVYTSQDNVKYIYNEILDHIKHILNTEGGWEGSRFTIEVKIEADY